METRIATTRRRKRNEGRRSGVVLAVMALLFPAPSVSIAPLALAEEGPRGSETEESGGETLKRLRESILDSRERVGEHEREEREIFDRLETPGTALGSATPADSLLRQALERVKQLDTTLEEAISQCPSPIPNRQVETS